MKWLSSAKAAVKRNFIPALFVGLCIGIARQLSRSWLAEADTFTVGLLASTIGATVGLGIYGGIYWAWQRLRNSGKSPSGI